jgi:signal transduction histidine kinase
MQLGKTIQAEENVILSTGERLWFASIKTPLRDVKGEVIGVVGNSLEITKLKEAQEKAELANKAKTEFLAVASHELRVPLTSILAIASMFAEGGISDADSTEYGKVILDSGTYLLSNINSILDFAKLEADKFELKPLPMDLRSHIEDVVNILKAFAEHKGIDLIISFPPTVPSKIVSDSRALRQVLVNLVNNAIRFTDAGHVFIKVKCLHVSADAAKISISIEDTGIGIPEEKLNAIFEGFSQVEDAYKRKSSRSGMGVGLSVVQRLVEILNGKIELTSTLGKGSIFSLTFDFQLQDASTQDIPWLMYASKVKILVVNDTSRAEIICSHTNAAICETITSDKAYSSLLSAQLMGQTYDILIIDNELRYKKPAELLAEINSHQTLKKPLTILLISNASVAEKNQAIKDGFFATVVKPIQPIAFQNALTAAWEQWIETKNNI